MDARVVNLTDAVAWLTEEAAGMRKERKEDSGNTEKDELSPEENALSEFEEHDYIDETIFYTVLSDAGVDDPLTFRNLSPGCMNILAGLQAFVEALRVMGKSSGVQAR